MGNVKFLRCDPKGLNGRRSLPIIRFCMSAPILIIDDEPDIRELIAYGLGRSGWFVETAGSGADALARLCGSRPSGIILDLVLPDIHGLGILETVRELWVVDPVPVIIISCLQTTELRTVAVAEGADAFLPKPFVLEDLITKVERLCQHKTRKAFPGVASGKAMLANGRRRTRTNSVAVRS